MNIKKISLVGMLAALYFVLSLTLKIPIAGNISLDLGYLALTVAAVCLGPVAGALVGGIGAAVESILLSPFGLSIGWVLMNVLIGLVVGMMAKSSNKGFDLIFGIVVAVLLGAFAKGFLECALYQIPFAVKLPKIISAFVIDTIVMIFGIPFAKMLDKRIKM